MSNPDEARAPTRRAREDCEDAVMLCPDGGHVLDQSEVTTTELRRGAALPGYFNSFPGFTADISFPQIAQTPDLLTPTGSTLALVAIPSGPSHFLTQRRAAFTSDQSNRRHVRVSYNVNDHIPQDTTQRMWQPGTASDAGQSDGRSDLPFDYSSNIAEYTKDTQSAPRTPSSPDRYVTSSMMRSSGDVSPAGPDLTLPAGPFLGREHLQRLPIGPPQPFEEMWATLIGYVESMQDLTIRIRALVDRFSESVEEEIAAKRDELHRTHAEGA